MSVCVCVFLLMYSECEKVFVSFNLISSLVFVFLSEQLPADLNKMHLTDHAHQQVTHMAPSQSGCSITSDSGSSSLSDIYQVGTLLLLYVLFVLVVFSLDVSNIKCYLRVHILGLFTHKTTIKISTFYYSSVFFVIYWLSNQYFTWHVANFFHSFKYYSHEILSMYQ